MTGENKKRFEEWYKKDYLHRKENIGLNVFHLRLFWKSTHEMQKGVIEAYYDSVGIEIEEMKIKRGQVFWWSNIDGKFESEYFNTRKEAIIAAFEEADKLRNKEL
jgi:hypothetical protein